MKQTKKSRLNYTDDFGRAQGFWEFPLPDNMGHTSNYEEGIFYNDKRVGVWYKRDYKKLKYEMQIFYDTSENTIEHFKYYPNLQIKEHGFLNLTPLGYKDTIRYTDAITGKEEYFLTDSSLMKQELWTFYYENGQIESEGIFKSDKKSGRWKYYNEKGELIKEEVY